MEVFMCNQCQRIHGDERGWENCCNDKKYINTPLLTSTSVETVSRKVKVFLVCLHADEKAINIKDAPEMGVEFMGTCFGIAIDDNGKILGQHTSSSLGWLRKDLIAKLENPDNYEIIDLIEIGTVPDFILDKIKFLMEGKDS